MNPEMQAQVERIKRISGIVQAICKVLLVVLIIAVISMVALIMIGPEGTKARVATVNIPLENLSPASKAMLLFWLIPISVVAMKFLYHLLRLFGHYAKGRIFTAEPVAQIKRLGQTTLLVAVIQFLDPAVASFVIRNSGLEGITVSYTLPGEPLIAGGLVILVSWIMDVGRQMQEESELTI